MKFYIYKLWFTEEPTTVYIGITKNLQKRLTNHLCDTSKTRKTNWLRDRFSRGYNFSYSVLHTANTLEEAKLTEQQMIVYYKSQGWILKNSTDGGDGQLGKEWGKESREKISRANKSRVVSAETREKISKRVSGENHPMYGVKGKDNPNFGRISTATTRNKISKALTGVPKSESAKEAMSRGQLKNTYELISPTGEIFTTNNLKAFAELHGLNRGLLNAVTLGKRPHTRGWKGRRL